MLKELNTTDEQVASQCLRDIVALSTLPAIWSGAPPLRIAESLAASLFTTLGPEFVYVSLAGDAFTPGVEVAQIGRYDESPDLARQLGPRILEWARAHDPDEFLLIPNPQGSGTVRVATRVVGHHAELGVIAAGFWDGDSPTAFQQLVLNVAATQVATAVQNTCLLRSLRESEQRFRRMIDALPAAIYTTDADGRVTHFNAAAADMAGREPQLGKDRWCVCWKLYRADGTPMPHDECLMAFALRENRPVRGEEVIIERPDGTRSWCVPYPTPLRDGEDRVVGGINMVVDITERKRAEQERDELLVREREARSEAERLNEVARMLAAELDVQRLVQKVTDVATASTGATFGAFFYNVANEHGESYQLYTLSGAPREAFEKFGLPRNTPMFEPTFRGKGPLRIDDVLADPRYGRTPPHYGMPRGHLPVRSYLAVPVLSRSGAVLGGLFFAHPQPGVFTEHAERLAVGIAAQAAIAIDNARLFDDAQKEIAQRRQSEEALRESEEFTRRVIESSHDCIKVLDLEARLLSMSPGGLRLLEIEDIGQFLNQSWFDFWQGADREAAKQAVAEARAGGVGKFEGYCPSVTGKPKWWNVVVTPISSRDGKPQRLLAVSRDITERRQVEQRLRQAEQEAVAANRAKDRFLAVLSHELRTPLTPVMMTVAAMDMNPDLAPNIRDDVAMIRRNVELEAKLIDDLLDLSRIVAGKLRLEQEVVDVNAAVRHVCGTCRPYVLEKGIHLHCNLPDRPPYVKADPARLQQILWNLLRNAAKFTPERGDIFVTVRMAGSDRVRVEVRDTGIGIAPDVLPRIFDAFEQGDARITQQFGGLGLGLAISKALVELHRGTIRAESGGPQQGSTFTVELPLVPARQDQSDGPRGSDGGSGDPLRVLLVEDHADTAKVLSKLLCASGHRVQTASSAAAAMALAERHPFDVIVSDLGLPDGTGYELMQKIRARYPMKGIAMSGYGMDEDLRKSREAGFSEHIVKPANVAQLERAIRRVMGREV